MGRPAVLKVDIIADAKGVGKGVDDAEGKFGRLGKFAGKAGKAVGLGMAAGALAVGAFAVSAVGAASDVQQAMGGVESVFGKNAKQVEAWASRADQAVGLSKAAYGNMATILGSQLRNMGRSSGQAAQQTNQLITLGADLAATYGGSVSDAVEAVSSLLKGETDPIERYGVSIKQSTIAADLHAKGLDNLKGKQLASAQATSALSLLMAQTTAAHGKFGQESNTLAGQQARLSAQFENNRAALGAKLLPVVTRAAAFLNTQLLPAAGRLSANLQRQLGPAIAAASAYFTTRLVPAAVAVYGWIVAKVVPAFRAYFMPALGAVRSAVAQVTKTLQDNHGNLAKLAHFLNVVVPPAAKFLGRVLGGVLGTEIRVIGTAISVVIAGIASWVGWIDTAIDKIKALGRAIKNSPLGKAAGALGKVFGAAPVAGMTAGRLMRPSSGVTPPMAGLATASAGAASGLTGLGFTAGGGLVVVDRRTIDARLVVEGDVVDQVGFARDLDRVSREHAQRVGKATTYGAAR